MRLAVISLVAVASLALATRIPAAADSTSTATIVTTAAEARMIDRLRDMAQPPEISAEVLPARTDVAMATSPAAAAPLKPASEKLVVVPAELNVRAEPSKQAAVLGRLKQGEAVEVASRDHGWVQIATADGTIGWASAEFMTAAN